MSSVTLAMIK